MGDTQWAAITCSIVGDLHIRKNLPNQDAVKFCEIEGHPPAFVMAISDGHGSEKCPRSDIGSELAVNTAIKIFGEFWKATRARLKELEIDEQQDAFLKIERHIRKDVTKQLVASWIAAVQSHYDSNPLEAEHSLAQRLLAYGATLTVVFLCEHFYVCMRLGDCEVLIVGADSLVLRVTPKDKLRVGEETNSLCMHDATERFDVLFDGSLSKDLPNTEKLFLVCSDGYEKAFESNAGFEQSAKDFFKLVTTEKGRETVQQEIGAWLRAYSNYSGDDVSLGLLFAKTLPSKSQESPEAHESSDLGLESGVVTAAPNEQAQIGSEDVSHSDFNEPPKTKGN